MPVSSATIDDPLLVFIQLTQFTPLNAHSSASLAAGFRQLSAPHYPFSTTSGTPEHSALRDPLWLIPKGVEYGAKTLQVFRDILSTKHKWGKLNLIVSLSHSFRQPAARQNAVESFFQCRSHVAGHEQRCIPMPHFKLKLRQVAEIGCVIGGKGVATNIHSLTTEYP